MIDDDTAQCGLAPYHAPTPPLAILLSRSGSGSGYTWVNYPLPAWMSFGIVSVIFWVFDDDLVQEYGLCAPETFVKSLLNAFKVTVARNAFHPQLNVHMCNTRPSCLSIPLHLKICKVNASALHLT